MIIIDYPKPSPPAEDSLICLTDIESKLCNISAVAPQGSVFGTFLWIIMYDRVLSPGAQTISFMDDIALVAVRKQPAEVAANEAAAFIWKKLTLLGLILVN